MFIAAATSCFSDLSFQDACQQIDDLEYDKVEISCDVGDPHLKSKTVADDPDEFVREFRELTRLSPVAFELSQDVSEEVLAGVVKAAKLLRVTQITVPASEVGTPFNSEIDRLRSLNAIALQEGIRLSIKTKTDTLTEDPHNAVEVVPIGERTGNHPRPELLHVRSSENPDFRHDLPICVSRTTPRYVGRQNSGACWAGRR